MIHNGARLLLADHENESLDKQKRSASDRY